MANVTTEDQLLALGLIMAHAEQPDATGQLPAEYCDHLFDAIEERGAIPVAHGLVTLATMFALTLAEQWQISAEEVIRRTAVALAKELNPT